MFPTRSPGRLTRPQTPPTPNSEDPLAFDNAVATSPTATINTTTTENNSHTTNTVQRRRTLSTYSANTQRPFEMSSLSPEEIFVFGQYFNLADVLGAGVLSGQQAVMFLSKSKLNQNILGEIWNLADADGQGSLTPQKFALALKLIAAAQQGRVPALSTLSEETPLPTFEGVRIESYKPPSDGHGTGTKSALNFTDAYVDVSGRPSTPDTSNHVPSISVEEQQKFGNMFFANSPVNGYLDGEKVKTIFMKSKLPVETLGKIWNLANPKKAGFIDVSEFCIAMHFIQGIMKGSIKSLPSVLPPILLSSSIPSPSAQSISPPISNASPLGGAGPSSPMLSAIATSGVRASVGSNTPNIASNTSGTAYIPVTRHKTGGPISGDPSMTAAARHASGLAPASGVVRHMTGGSSLSGIPSTGKMSLFDGDDEGGVWEVTKEQREKFDRFFQGLDIEKKGYITGEEGVKFFTNSKLAPTTLGQIWELADRTKTGRLSREEFAVAMHLIQKCIAGAPLPAALPASLAETLKAPSQSSASSGTYSASRKSFGGAQDFPPAKSAGRSPSYFSDNAPPHPKTDSLQEETVVDIMRGMEDAQRESATFTTQTPDLIAKRNVTEGNIALLHIQRQDMNARLAQAKASYETEVRLLREAEQSFASQEQEISSLRAETEQAERILAELQIEKEGVNDQLRNEEETASTMKQKLVQVKKETAELRSEIERIGMDLMAIQECTELARKQLTAAESDRNVLTAEKSRLSEALNKIPPVFEDSISSGLHASTKISTAASSTTGGAHSDPFGNSSSFENGGSTIGGFPAGAFGDVWNALTDQTPQTSAPLFASAFDLQPKIYTSALHVGETHTPLTSAPAELNKKESEMQDDPFRSNSPRRPATSETAARQHVGVDDLFADFVPFSESGRPSVPSSTKAPFQNFPPTGTPSDSAPASPIKGASFAGFQVPGSFGDKVKPGCNESTPSASSERQGVFSGEFDTAFGASFSDPTTQAERPGSPAKSPGAVINAFESSPTDMFSTSPAKSAASGMEGFESRFPALEGKDSMFGFEDHFGELQERPPTFAAQPQIASNLLCSTHPAPFRTSSERPPTTERVVSSYASDRYSTTSEDLSFVSAPSQPSTGLSNAGDKKKERPRSVSPARDEFDAAFSELDSAPVQGGGTSHMSKQVVVPELDSIFSTADFEFDPHFDEEVSAHKREEGNDLDPGTRPNGPKDSIPGKSPFPAFFDDAFFPPESSAPASTGSDLDAAFGGFRKPDVESRSTPFGPFGSDPFGKGPHQQPFGLSDGGFSFDEAFGTPSKTFGETASVRSGALEEAEDIESVKNLMGLGFDRDRVLEALEKFGYDETLATNHLLEVAAGK